MPESHVGPAKVPGVSQKGRSFQSPKGDSPPDESEARAQSRLIKLLPCSCSETSMKPEVNMPTLPAFSYLAAAPPPNELQPDPKVEAPEEIDDALMSKATGTKNEEFAMEISKIAGISLPISHLCLARSDWDREIALDAINFAADFASPNGLTLQASILCLENSLWDMDDAALVAGRVAKEVSGKTGMTIDWSIECLHANGWTAKGAVEAFEMVKVSILFFHIADWVNWRISVASIPCLEIWGMMTFLTKEVAIVS